MNETSSNLVQIVVPELNKDNYGESIATQFKNIDTNFRNIVNSEFLKGKQGESVANIEVSLNSLEETGIYINGKNQTGLDFYEMIKNFIINEVTPDSKLNPITITETQQEINWFDYLKDSKIIMICSKDIDDSNSKLTPISSSIYVLKDARYNEFYKTYDKITDSYSEVFDEIEDVSCIIYWNNNKFDKYTTFPTLYYDKYLKDFCWKLNGSETSIPATGPIGKAGADGKIWVVTVNDLINQNESSSSLTITNEFKEYPIYKVFVGGTGFVLTENAISEYGVDFGEHSSAIVFKESSLADSNKETEIGKYWISQIYHSTKSQESEENTKTAKQKTVEQQEHPGTTYWMSEIQYRNISLSKVPVVCINEGMSIKGLQSNMTFLQMLRNVGNIGKDSVSVPFGLFVPTNNNSKVDTKLTIGDVQEAHGLFAVNRGGNVGTEAQIIDLTHEPGGNWKSLLLAHTNNILGGNALRNLSVADLFVNYNTHFLGNRNTISDGNQTLFYSPNSIGYKISSSIITDWQFNMGIYPENYNYKKDTPFMNLFKVINKNKEISLINAVQDNLHPYKMYLGKNDIIVNLKQNINPVDSETNEKMPVAIDEEIVTENINKTFITIIPKEYNIFKTPIVKYKLNNPLNGYTEDYKKAIDPKCCFIGINNTDPQVELDVIGSVKVSEKLLLKDLDLSGNLNIGKNTITGNNIIAQGNGNSVTTNNSFASGTNNSVSGQNSAVFGTGNKSTGSNSFTIGTNNTASGENAFAGGNGTTDESGNNTASGKNSIVFGYNNIAKGQNSQSFGSGNKSNSNYSFTTGSNNVVDGEAGHAEGINNNITSKAGHAEGINNIVNGIAGHAEGNSCKAIGQYSHTEGFGTITNNANEHAEGKYNYSGAGRTLSSIGIGSSETSRKNACEVTNNGNIYINGVGGYNGSNHDLSTVKDLKTVILDIKKVTIGGEGEGSLIGHTHDVNDRSDLRDNDTVVKIACDDEIVDVDKTVNNEISFAVWETPLKGTENTGKTVTIKRMTEKSVKNWIGDLMPIGSIILWTKTSAKLAGIKDIPEGWVICDGRDVPGAGISTPNMTDSFIRGISDIETTEKKYGDNYFTLTKENIPDISSQYELSRKGNQLSPDIWDKEEQPNAPTSSSVYLYSLFGNTLHRQQESDNGKSNHFFMTTDSGVISLNKMLGEIKITPRWGNITPKKVEYIPEYYTAIYIMKYKHS